jgi:hypothetical protein
MYQSISYKGKFADKQLYSGKNIIMYEQDVFTLKQNMLYKQLLFGYNAYDRTDLDKMSTQQLHVIKTNYVKTQRVINLYKQEKLNKLISNWLCPIFPCSVIIKDLCKSYTDKKFFCTLSFKELNISKKDIVSLLIEYKLLPVNFYSL